MELVGIGAGVRAFLSAAHYDPQVMAWFGEVAGCYTLPGDLIGRDGVLQKVMDVALATEPYQTPGPTRAELEAALA